MRRLDRVRRFDRIGANATAQHHVVQADALQLPRVFLASLLEQRPGIRSQGRIACRDRKNKSPYAERELSEPGVFLLHLDLQPRPRATGRSRLSLSSSETRLETISRRPTYTVGRGSTPFAKSAVAGSSTLPGPVGSPHDGGTGSRSNGGRLFFLLGGQHGDPSGSSVRVRKPGCRTA